MSGGLSPEELVRFNQLLALKPGDQITFPDGGPPMTIQIRHDDGVWLGRSPGSVTWWPFPDLAREGAKPVIFADADGYAEFTSHAAALEVVEAARAVDAAFGPGVLLYRPDEVLDRLRTALVAFDEVQP